MLRIAHLSDTHVNGSSDRSRRLVAGLSKAREAGAKHLLLTGDLTAHDRVQEFLELQNILAWEWPFLATVIPGNHDRQQNFERVFGKLPGPVVLPETVIVPIDTRVGKRAFIFRALGNVGKAQIESIRLIAGQVSRPVILAMHHGAQLHPLHFFDGLIDRQRILSLLKQNSNIHICCGHDHRVLDIGDQIHTAASCALHEDPLRLYDVGVGGFKIAYRSTITGSTGFAGPPR